MTAAPAGLKCWNCGASLDELPRPITRHMNCPECFEDLHCCRMCRHFTDNVTNPCADERAEPPVHKEGANFCDFFRPASDSYRAGRKERGEQARSNLAALFAKPRAEDAPEAPDAPAASTQDAEEAKADPAAIARRKLDGLFR